MDERSWLMVDHVTIRTAEMFPSIYYFSYSDVLKVFSTSLLQHSKPLLFA